jgi:hypothetical protein
MILDHCWKAESEAFPTVRCTRQRMPRDVRASMLEMPESQCLARADGTARVTAWESRKSLELFNEVREHVKLSRSFSCAPGRTL